MAEIKSTLDIIMEKTKNLTMTDEEKEFYKQKERSGKLKGLIQKTIDGVISMDQMKVKMASLVDKDPDLCHQLIREETTDRLSPGDDNTAVLALLEVVEGIESTGIKQLLKDYEKKIEMEKGGREKIFMERLKKRGISGSAVIPNINADPEWKNFLKDLKDTFRKEIATLFRNFLF